ncbi:MAG: fibronectin type III domain-containing protein, partial [Chloroflexota bacterium]
MRIKVSHIPIVSCMFFTMLLVFFRPWKAYSQAQVYPVSVTTQITPPYSVNLADYAAPGSEQLKVIIVQRDLTHPQYRLYLKMEIQLNGRTIVRTSPNYNPPAFVLEPGIPTLISGSSLTPYFNPANMEFTGYSRDQYIRSKLFPEGAYVITFTAYDWTRRDVELSRGGSFYCFLAKTEPPLLNLPLNNALVTLSSPQYINFQWLSRNATSPNSALSTRYRFELFEMRVGGISPSEIVTRTQPFFSVETDRTNIIYSIPEPSLEKGLRYIWRVKAFDTQGRDFIRNNGYSEAFSFVYGEGETGVIDFTAVGNFTAQAASPRKAKLSWNASSSYNSYRIYYRKQGSGNKWYESETVQNTAEINGLSPGSIYECKVQGKRGNAWGSFSNTDTVGMPMLPVIECGSPFMPLNVTNREPLLELMRLQEFDAGGFMVTLADPYAITTSPGRFSGKGFVQVPLFGHKKIRCEFSDVFINTDYRMVEGIIRLITDNTDGRNAIWDIDEVFEGGTENGTVIEGTEEVSLVI